MKSIYAETTIKPGATKRDCQGVTCWQPRLTLIDPESGRRQTKHAPQVYLLSKRYAMQTAEQWAQEARENGFIGY